ncbi:MAG: hypothetical protein JG779_1035 [Thermotoga sp.]|nr:hypothetical protein [Thermotoga sp.]
MNGCVNRFEPEDREEDLLTWRGKHGESTRFLHSTLLCFTFCLRIPCFERENNVQIRKEEKKPGDNPRLQIPSSLKIFSTSSVPTLFWASSVEAPIWGVATTLSRFKSFLLISSVGGSTSKTSSPAA